MAATYSRVVAGAAWAKRAAGDAGTLHSWAVRGCARREALPR